MPGPSQLYGKPLSIWMASTAGLCTDSIQICNESELIKTLDLEVKCFQRYGNLNVTVIVPYAQCVLLKLSCKGCFGND
jgi:hypothetical protein